MLKRINITNAGSHETEKERKQYLHVVHRCYLVQVSKLEEIEHAPSIYDSMVRLEHLASLLRNAAMDFFAVHEATRGKHDHKETLRKIIDHSKDMIDDLRSKIEEGTS